MEYESGGQWQRARHLQLLCEKLEAVERGEITRLMVFMPPRHGKSEVVTKKFPAWYLGRNPTKEVIMASYSSDLALDHSRIARDTFIEWGGRLWGKGIAQGSSAVNRWNLQGYRGGVTAVGVRGPITGRGADIAIIDDPFKDWQEADSETIREAVWMWYKSTLRTRLAPKGAIVLVMTRWHEDDLAGRLLLRDPARQTEETKKLLGDEKTGDTWEVVEIPAEAVDGAEDILGRGTGQWLWPERFTEEEYEATKAVLGSYLFEALYQQSPSPAAGTILQRKWWQYYRALPARFDEMLQSWDCSFKDTDGTDFVVGQVWGRLGGEFYLVHQVRDRMDFPTTVQAIKQVTAKYPHIITKLVEDKANGPAVISAMRRQVSGLIAVTPDGGKVVRARAVSGLVQAGNVYLPDPSIAPWIGDFVEECTKFPKGKKDDQVDACTQALNRLSKGQGRVSTARKGMR